MCPGRLSLIPIGAGKDRLAAGGSCAGSGMFYHQRHPGPDVYKRQGVHIAFEFEHLLGGDIVGHHPPGGAFGSQLGEIVVRGILVDVVLFQHVDEFGAVSYTHLDVYKRQPQFYEVSAADAETLRKGFLTFLQPCSGETGELQDLIGVLGKQTVSYTHLLRR